MLVWLAVKFLISQSLPTVLNVWEVVRSADVGTSTVPSYLR